jgi:ABC-2 type transport system ATP-binding protein
MTTISLEGAAIGSGLGAPVPPLTLTLEPGVPAVLSVETDERPLLVSMLIGGRLKPDAGSVLIDGRADADALRRASALVDTPFVAEPPADIALSRVIAEEFSFSDRPSSGREVLRFLQQHGLADYAKLPVRALPPTDRIRLMCELAASRRGVSALVFTSPERHGVAPADWYPSIADIAARGLSVIVVTDAPTASLLLALGATDPTIATVAP